MNQLVLEEVDESSYDWKILPSLYQEGYFDLISGRFLIKDISAMMPDLVKNWLDVSYQTDDLVSSTAALAWDEMFPNTLDQMMINEAASRFERSDVNENGRKEGLELFDSIKAWAEREGLAEDLAKATEPMLEGYNMEVANSLKIRELIKVSIEFLLEQKAELENVVQEDIDWSEGLQTNLKDVHDQLGEMESDMTDDIAASFRHIKNSVTQQLKSELPKLLQNCSQFIEEDSNFSTLHVDLNEEMNRRMAVYMKNFVKDNLKSTIQDWIGDCKREFESSQRTFDE